MNLVVNMIVQTDPLVSLLFVTLIVIQTSTSPRFSWRQDPQTCSLVGCMRAN
uniref:Uncharacterized protein n=1 Tax=Arundo donax TaxID=35708 RepID=A0A0A8Y5E3_ARUDO